MFFATRLGSRAAMAAAWSTEIQSRRLRNSSTHYYPAAVFSNGPRAPRQIGDLFNATAAVANHISEFFTFLSAC